jgi:hypothetical protein
MRCQCLVCVMYGDQVLLVVLVVSRVSALKKSCSVSSVPSVISVWLLNLLCSVRSGWTHFYSCLFSLDYSQLQPETAPLHSSIHTYVEHLIGICLTLLAMRWLAPFKPCSAASRLSQSSVPILKNKSFRWQVASRHVFIVVAKLEARWCLGLHF